MALFVGVCSTDALLPGILLLLAFSANAANMTVDGGVLQAFRVEAGPHRRVEPGLTTPPDTVVMIAIQSVPATSTTTTVATAP